MSTAPPIEPAPAGLPANRGCWNKALLGCGGAAVLIVACLVGLGIYVQKNPARVMDFVMDKVRDRYASDVTAQDKADLEQAYSEFRTALEAKRVRRDDVERVRMTIRMGGEVHHDDVVELTRVFREAAAGGAPAEPSPVPGPESRVPTVAVTP